VAHGDGRLGRVSHLWGEGEDLWWAGGGELRD
jgi:hypothetical protein